MSSTYFHLAFMSNNNFLTDKPQITFFKFVYKKFANFSMEFLEENTIGINNFGNELTCKLSKIGDLIYQMFIKIELPCVAISTNNLDLEHNNQEQIS